MLSRFVSTARSGIRTMGSATAIITEGAAIPRVTFKTRTRVEGLDQPNPFDWKDVTTEDLFANKRVVLFSLPGAFTPTCSSQQLPGYTEAYAEILAQDVDDVYCLSVNDAFVMRQWGISQGLEEDPTPGSLGTKTVKLLPDGACLFTRGMGMSCTWEAERGFGERSWRYSAVINDMKIEKLFVEAGSVNQDSKEDPFETSGADVMMEYLQGNPVA